MNLSTTKSNLKIASISDVHLGHSTNSTSSIIVNLRRDFPDNTETAALDYIFIVGDLFDGLLTLPDQDVLGIKEWMAYMLRLCKKHDIALRILEGTPSHDWRQSQLFLDIDALLAIGANIKYFNTLHIEYEQAHDMWVLFVPDECDATTEKTLSRVKNLLKQNGIDKVDYALMHGQFEYQLPSFVKAPKHDSAAYLDIVKYYIFIGHVHTFSHYMRIIAQGSYDRLRQNEDEKKGHVRVYREGEDHRVVFVENVGAKIYSTIDCTDLDVNALLAKIDTAVSGAPDDSYFRIRAEAGHSIFSNMEVLIRRYPTYNWSKITNEDEVEKIRIVEEEKEDATYQPIVISPMTVGLLMNDQLYLHGHSEDFINATMQLFNQGVIDYG